MAKTLLIKVLRELTGIILYKKNFGQASDSYDEKELNDSDNYETGWNFSKFFPSLSEDKIVKENCHFEVNWYLSF